MMTRLLLAAALFVASAASGQTSLSLGLADTFSRPLVVKGSQGGADFHVAHHPFGNSGTTRANDVAYIGWNVDPRSGTYDPADTSIGWGFEDHYQPAGIPYTEAHLNYGSVRRNTRLITTAIRKDNDFSGIAMNADEVHFGDADQNVLFLLRAAGKTIDLDPSIHLRWGTGGSPSNILLMTDAGSPPVFDVYGGFGANNARVRSGGYLLPWSVEITAGIGAPCGACVTGSIYARIDGGQGSTLYVCEAAAWSAK